ncbi:LytTR family transcriptional regulator [Roseibium denhamense]|uniref:LytTr DNA-binding domain-containing protein n=1 Tax=Roseibium denhamense TaxID=76305 RepID=A0ABY1NK14_9HYPH|nr:LytTR family DNA-binding domain-containing protein [Roseibium denhamense]MTI06742.1 LytTR family transcriptional regulator [Roseibium denhamense]SMP10824.1 LytTr DNA-binding domain-containing protein [Roseibium denhamense]
MEKRELGHAVIVAAIVAGMLAANEVARPQNWTPVGLYLYWATRIAIEAGLFLSTFQALFLAPQLSRRPVVHGCLAAVISFFPFVLAVTALDIVLGLPELDLSIGGPATPGPRLLPFAQELGYLIDNHLVLSLLLWCTIMFTRQPDIRRHPANETAEEIGARPPEKKGNATQTNGFEKKSDLEAGPPKLLKRLAPDLQGQLLRVEAQEHYVRLVTEDGNSMVLYRFGDILHELADIPGMQVHRSHWIADICVGRVYRQGHNLRISARDGETIPVSRKFSAQVQRRYETLFQKK